MNQSANLTTAAPKTGGSSFSFKRLGQLLRLDFAFHHRQWLQILIGGFLAASIPVIVSVLTSLLFGMGLHPPPVACTLPAYTAASWRSLSE